MERDIDERAGKDSLPDGAGMERPNELPAMESGDPESREDEATGDEKTAIEGAAGIAATHRAFGGGADEATGGIGTRVPTDDDAHMDADRDEAEGSTDPRGY
ncbi:MAG TPA: hypothetical protein VHQ42_01250 [Candidatus Limnocylindria bacterium]|nr:hypothetical protein [Candidatus Limnocylindria bacterium]